MNDTWEPLGGSPFYVRAMCYFGGSLFVSGTDSTSVTSIYKWGAQWQKIGTVHNGADYSTITSMMEFDGHLVVAGTFGSVDDVPARNIAAWDGSAWMQFGTGLPDEFGGGRVDGLTVHQGALIASGYSLGLSLQGGVVRWNGSAWEQIGDINGSRIVPASIGGELFLGGYLWRTGDPNRVFWVARWDGQEWVELGSGTNGPVNSFVGQNGYLFLGGAFSWAGGKSSFGMARWDGLLASTSTPRLLPVAPNPFHSSTTISYTLPKSGPVRISVIDVHGRELVLLESGDRQSGPHSVTWDGRDQDGRTMPSGVYFMRAALPGNTLTKKIVRLR